MGCSAVPHLAVRGEVVPLRLLPAGLELVLVEPDRQALDGPGGGHWWVNLDG